MTSALTLCCPQRQGRPQLAPLLALSGSVLAAGSCELVTTYALTARRARALRLATIRLRPGEGLFAALALEPRGEVLAVLVLDDSHKCEHYPGECPVANCISGAVAQNPPALLLLVPETLRLLARVELSHLPVRNVPVTPLLLCSRPDRRPGLLVVLPTIAILMQPDGGGLCVERRLKLELPFASAHLKPVRLLCEESRECTLRPAAVPLAVPLAGATVINAVAAPCIELASEGVASHDFVAVCSDDGSVAIYEMLCMKAPPLRNLQPVVYSSHPCSEGNQIPLVISYSGDCCQILAVSKVLRLPGSIGVIAVALAIRRTVPDATEEHVGDSEETRSPPRVIPDHIQAVKSTLYWVVLSGCGEAGSCEVLQPISGAASLLRAEDYPLSCTVSATGAVHAVSRRGAVLTLYPDAGAICKSLDHAPRHIAQPERAVNLSRTVVASCTSSGTRLALMRQSSASAVEAPGSTEESFEIELIAAV